MGQSGPGCPGAPPPSSDGSERRASDLTKENARRARIRASRPCTRPSRNTRGARSATRVKLAGRTRHPSATATSSAMINHQYGARRNGRRICPDGRHPLDRGDEDRGAVARPEDDRDQESQTDAKQGGGKPIRLAEEKTVDGLGHPLPLSGAHPHRQAARAPCCGRGARSSSTIEWSTRTTLPWPMRTADPCASRHRCGARAPLRRRRVYRERDATGARGREGGDHRTCARWVDVHHANVVDGHAREYTTSAGALTRITTRMAPMASESTLRLCVAYRGRSVAGAVMSRARAHRGVPDRVGCCSS